MLSELSGLFGLIQAPKDKQSVGKDAAGDLVFTDVYNALDSESELEAGIGGSNSDATDESAPVATTEVEDEVDSTEAGQDETPDDGLEEADVPFDMNGAASDPDGGQPDRAPVGAAHPSASNIPPDPRTGDEPPVAAGTSGQRHADDPSLPISLATEASDLPRATDSTEDRMPSAQQIPAIAGPQTGSQAPGTQKSTPKAANQLESGSKAIDSESAVSLDGSARKTPAAPLGTTDAGGPSRLRPARPEGREEQKSHLTTVETQRVKVNNHPVQSATTSSSRRSDLWRAEEPTASISARRQHDVASSPRSYDPAQIQDEISEGTLPGAAKQAPTSESIRGSVPKPEVVKTNGVSGTSAKLEITAEATPDVTRQPETVADRLMTFQRKTNESKTETRNGTIRQETPAAPPIAGAQKLAQLPRNGPVDQPLDSGKAASRNAAPASPKVSGQAASGPAMPRVPAHTPNVTRMPISAPPSSREPSGTPPENPAPIKRMPALDESNPSVRTALKEENVQQTSDVKPRSQSVSRAVWKSSLAKSRANSSASAISVSGSVSTDMRAGKERGASLSFDGAIRKSPTDLRGQSGRGAHAAEPGSPDKFAQRGWGNGTMAVQVESVDPDRRSNVDLTDPQAFRAPISPATGDSAETSQQESGGSWNLERTRGGGTAASGVGEKYKAVGAEQPGFLPEGSDETSPKPYALADNPTPIDTKNDTDFTVEPKQRASDVKTNAGDEVRIGRSTALENTVETTKNMPLASVAGNLAPSGQPDAGTLSLEITGNQPAFDAPHGARSTGQVNHPSAATDIGAIQADSRPKPFPTTPQSGAEPVVHMQMPATPSQPIATIDMARVISASTQTNAKAISKHPVAATEPRVLDEEAVPVADTRHLSLRDPRAGAAKTMTAPSAPFDRADIFTPETTTDASSPKSGATSFGKSLEDAERFAESQSPGVASGDIRIGPAAGHAAPQARADQAASVVRQLVDAIAAAPSASGDTIELRVSPDELGNVRFRMAQGEHGLTVNIVADRPETLDMLRRNIDQLSRYLSDLGYSSTGFTFGDGQAGSQNGGGRSMPVTPQDIPQAADPAEIAAPLPIASGGLDLRI
ncbi:flagellar hook-length control protein FliK [Salipiger aestuarii]|uniref:flagellar hook-length control protein FliK n=1 Tax=Salipiger aestuarii TaxID=568098 RepID=UPI00123C1E22|nr:flagellar hook-length control protein FliK [Salipiger aestuarii]